MLIICFFFQEFANKVIIDGLWLSFAPVIDGDVIPEAPMELLKKGEFIKAPMIMSLTKDEVTIWFWNSKFEFEDL